MAGTRSAAGGLRMLQLPLLSPARVEQRAAGRAHDTRVRGAGHRRRDHVCLVHPGSPRPGRALRDRLPPEAGAAVPALLSRCIGARRLPGRRRPVVAAAHAARRLSGACRHAAPALQTARGGFSAAHRLSARGPGARRVLARAARRAGPGAQGGAVVAWRRQHHAPGDPLPRPRSAGAAHRIAGRDVREPAIHRLSAGAGSLLRGTWDHGASLAGGDRRLRRDSGAGVRPGPGGHGANGRAAPGGGAGTARVGDGLGRAGMALSAERRDHAVVSLGAHRAPERAGRVATRDRARCAGPAAARGGAPVLARLLKDVLHTLRGEGRAGKERGDRPSSAAEEAASCYRSGIRCLESDEPEDARLALERAVELDPGLAEAHFALGLAWSKLGDVRQATQAYLAALRCRPGYAEAHSNLANLLFVHYDDVEGTLHHAQAALALDPEFRAAQLNLAMVKQFTGRCEEAIAIAQGILARDPGNDKARFASGLAYLMMGDFEHGWPAFEARKTSDSRSYVPRAFDYPEWDGSPLRGKTVLVHAEQGLGDEIMFASCLPQVMAAAQHCVIDCHEKLEKLFRRSFSGATVHGARQIDTDLSWLAQAPKIDCKVACGTLPLFLRRRAADFPRHTGYLRADPARVEYWRGRLRELGPGLKAGVSWRGGSKHTHTSIRSLELEQLAPVLRVPGVRFVSLQYGDCREETARFSAAHGLAVHCWQEAIDDYDETAALVCALDLVISVQTALVHLTGALGRPAWVLVSAASEWRYQRSGEEMPWYPSVRIVRQRELRRWEPVIEEAARRLRELAVQSAC